MEEQTNIENPDKEKGEYKTKVEDIRKMIVFLKSETIKEILKKENK